MSIQPNRVLPSLDVIVNRGGPTIDFPGTTTAVIPPTNRTGCVFYPPYNTRIGAGLLPLGFAIPDAHTSSPSMVAEKEISNREQHQKVSIVDQIWRGLPPSTTATSTTTTQGAPPRIVNLQYLENGGTIVTLQDYAQLLKTPPPPSLEPKQHEFVAQQFQVPIQNQKKMRPIAAARQIVPTATTMMAAHVLPTDGSGQNTIVCNQNAAAKKSIKRQLVLARPLSSNKRTRQARQIKKSTERKRFPTLPRTAFDLFRRDQERLLGFDMSNHWSTIQWKRLPPEERFKYDEKATLDHERFEKQVRFFQYSYH